MLDGLCFETWSILSRRGVVDYCSLVAWQVTRDNSERELQLQVETG
jgi:hypothetical protein